MKINSDNIINSYATASSAKQTQEMDQFKMMLDKAKNSKDAEQIKKVSAEFEAFFLKNIFKNMRKHSDENDGFFVKSEARKMYEQMMDEKMSEHISTGRGIGLADKLYKQMIRQYGFEEDDQQLNKIDVKK